MKFSIVVPVKDEVDLIPKTLPSYYAVNPSEVVICLDKPPLKEVVEIVKKIAYDYCAEDITKIVEVEESPEWSYHEAHVRRVGFRKARYDKILTVCIDVVINRNVLKALELVGKNDIGMVSCIRFYYPNNLIDFYRAVGTGILNNYIRKLAEFHRGKKIPRIGTSLVALWRPYWLDSESQEDLKKLPHFNAKLPKTSFDKLWTLNIDGEDTFLYQSMKMKHKVVHLNDIGGIVLRFPVERHPHMHYLLGFQSALKGRALLGVLLRTFLQAEPYYLKGYLDGKKCSCMA